MAELVRRIYSFADSSPRLAIDIGTGSGCLALALARWFPQCTVIASDVSPTALSLARENWPKRSIEERTSRRRRLSSAVQGTKFDLVSCQPALCSRGPTTRASPRSKQTGAFPRIGWRGRWPQCLSARFLRKYPSLWIPAGCWYSRWTNQTSPPATRSCVNNCLEGRYSWSTTSLGGPVFSQLRLRRSPRPLRSLGLDLVQPGMTD